MESKNPMGNPLNKYFKETFTKVDVAQDYLEHYLPKAIHHPPPRRSGYARAPYGQLCQQGTQEHFSDMLFKL